MKKLLNILFWIAISVLVVIIANNLYQRYRPDVELKPVIPDSSQQEGSEEQPDNEVMAPDFSLEDIDGNEVKLSDYRGRIVFLNFWAVWCPYCVQEMPDLDSASKKLVEGNDAVILAIDVNEDLETVKGFLDEKNLSLPVLMDYDGKVSKMYGVNAFPTTLVVDRDGKVVGYRTGPLTEGQIMNLVEEIK